MRRDRRYDDAMSRRRRLAVILGALAAGAAINVAVAWSCAWLADLPPSSQTTLGDPWLSQPDVGWPDRPTSTEHYDGIWEDLRAQCAGPIPTAPDYLQAAARFGLPMRSMQTDYTLGPGHGDFQARGIPLPQRRGEVSRWLPTVPLIPGFAVDTALYASGLLLLAAIPGRVRRWRRRRRGACLACGYASGGLAVCPECGEGAR
jgi:hypothetical protein